MDVGVGGSDLVGVDDDLALLLVRAGDDEHVVEAGGEVHQALVLVGGQHVAAARLQQVHAALVHCQPQVLGPVRGEGLLNKSMNVKYLLLLKIFVDTQF